MHDGGAGRLLALSRWKDEPPSLFAVPATLHDDAGSIRVRDDANRDDSYRFGDGPMRRRRVYGGGAVSVALRLPGATFECATIGNRASHPAGCLRTAMLPGTRNCHPSVIGDPSAVVLAAVGVAVRGSRRERGARRQ